VSFGIGVRSVVIAMGLVFFASGCAGVPLIQQSSVQKAPAAERAMLAGAVRQVKLTPWTAPQKVSFAARITGAGAGDSGRITRSETIAVYVGGLLPAGARFMQLAQDAQANLAAADRLLRSADQALGASRLSMDDVTIVESAIQALRENRQMYMRAARSLEQLGEPVDAAQLAAIREDYHAAIKSLGRAADALADQAANNRNQTYAAPKPSLQRNFTY